MIKKAIVSVVVTALWVGLSEFARNELLFKSLWTEKYGSLGMAFPSEPINGAVWMLWSLLFAGFVFVIAKKFTAVQTALISWFAFFVAMWLVIGNLNVLPYGLLWYAVPLSLLEAGVATLIVKKLGQ